MTNRYAADSKTDLLAGTRRHFLRTGPLALGGMYLASQGNASAAERETGFSNRLPFRVPATAKNVIYLHMAGSPPGLDLLDYKPELVARTGEDAPASFLEGKRFAFTSGTPKLLGSPRKWVRAGECGTWMSDAIPHLHEVADDICVIRSVHTDQFNHAPAQLMLLTGSPRQGRPSMGSWVTYGLGTENENLPGFVVLISGGTNPSAGKNAWGSGFLPSVFQGVQCRSKGDPVLYVQNPDGVPREVRRRTLDALNDLNRMQADRLGHPETDTRIAQYELAFRMQMSIPEVTDTASETADTLAAYGATPGDGSFASNCLLARRLVESGVRFVQLFDWGWDFHGTAVNEGLTEGLTRKGARMGQPFAALLKDLKRRGLLDETLVVWGGEFGRTPFREGRTAGSKILGRDHFPDCYQMILAGGGVKAGHVHGTTDELGFGVAEDPVHVHDVQATILHLLGIQHERLTYRFQGRDFRLTDVHGDVVHDILA